MTKSFKISWLKSKFLAKDIWPYLPTVNLALLFIIATVFLIVIASLSSGWFVLGLNLGILIISLLDLALLPRRKDYQFKRILPPEVERGQAFQVELIITSRSPQKIRFRLRDVLPVSFSNPFPLHGFMHSAQPVVLHYQSKASLRGDYLFTHLFFRYRSYLGLWEKQIIYKSEDKIKVIPDLSSARGSLLAIQKMLLEQGFKVKKNQLGSGEFVQVRPYVLGDDPRKINWRQTAKLNELMTNVYEPEHGKHISILIDCGRSMGVALDSSGNRLERALEAALTVSAVALQQGDYVSVLAFSNRILRYIPIGKNMTHQRTILEGTYNLQVESFESNYATAFNHLQTFQKRQSLLLIFSDLDPFIQGGLPLSQLHSLRRKHQLIILGIADPLLKKWAKSEPKDSQEALMIGLAHKEILKRSKEITKIARMGITLIEADENHLAAEAVSQYIAIINREAL